MVGTFSKIAAAVFGSKTSLASSAYPSSASVWRPDEEDTRSEKIKRRRWNSFRFSKRRKDFNRSTTEPTKQVNEAPISKEKGRVEALQPLGPPLPCPAPQPLPKELPKPDNREATLALQRANTGLEALSVLLDYVANRIDGFSAPFLKKELERERQLRIGTQLECEEVKSALNQLRDRFNSEKLTYDANINKILTEKQEEKFTIESEYKAIISDYEKKIQEIENNSSSQIRQLEDSLNNVTLEKDSLEYQIKQQNEEEKEKLLKQKEKYLHDYAQLRKMHQNELCELKSKLLNKFRSTAEKENRFKEELETVVQQHEALQKKISVYQEIINDTPELKNSVRKVKQLESDVSSLKSVLEIRTQELHDLRKKTQHWKQDADELPGAVIKIKTLSARIEDLTAQLSEKEKSEQNLMKENKLLLDSLNNECEQKKRLQMHNEELQWKLRQNIEVANALAKLYGGNYSPTCGASKKSPLRVSNVSSPKAWDVNSDDVPIFDESPPESPRVKAVIQKSDSVSWVVDIDDTPSCVASRLLRRAKSFNRTPPSSNLPPRVCKSLPNHNKRKKLKTSRKEILETDEYIREEVILVKSIGDGNFLQYIEYDDEDAEINIGDSDTSVQNREDDMQNMTELDRLGYLDINLKKAKSLEPRIFPCEPYSPKVAVEKAKSLIELHIKSENRSQLKESGGEAKCEEPDSEFLLHVRSKKNFELDDGIKFEEENITEDNTIMEDKNDLSWSDESYPSEG